MNTDKKHTQLDLLLEVIRMVQPNMDPMECPIFTQQILPMLKRIKKANEVLSEEQYSLHLETFRRDLPHFRQYLLQFGSAQAVPGFGRSNAH